MTAAALLDTDHASTVRTLMDALGNPQRRLRAVHITGSNGKGSTAAMCALLLAASGLEVGLFTSPHLSRAYERIAVNGEAISDADLSSALYRVRLAALSASVQPTWFEAMTAAALMHFDRCGVEAAVIEVGTSDRWDATNVVDAEVAVVTNVDGDAYEKAGIVRAGSTVVLGDRDRELASHFERQMPARILLLDRDMSVIGNADAPTGAADYTTPWGSHTTIELALAGAFQRNNALCALAAAESFLQSKVDSQVIADVFGAVRLPGRFEVLGDAPKVIVDCADNEVAAAALHPLVDNAIQAEERSVLVCGLTSGQDARRFLASLGADRFDDIVATEPDTPRAQPSTAVAAAAAAIDVNVVDQPTISTALQSALSLAGASGLVVVVGSPHLVGPVRELYGALGYANNSLRRATRS